MLDFKALRDPEVQARLRAEREEDERKREEKDKELQGMLDRCLDAYEGLSERERSFIRSCRTRMGTYLPLSEAQEKWLRGIAARLPT